MYGDLVAGRVAVDPTPARNMKATKGRMNASAGILTSMSRCMFAWGSNCTENDGGLHYCNIPVVNHPQKIGFKHQCECGATLK
jgi:hypothetical protein